MAALPYCVKHDWPDPFTSLGTVREKSQPVSEGAMIQKIVRTQIDLLRNAGALHRGARQYALDLSLTIFHRTRTTDN